MSNYLSINNQQIHYHDTGDRNKPAILLMHGFLMNLDMFTHQVNALKEQFRVITFDTRGFGQTRWDGTPFSLYDIVDDALALLDHLDIEQAVISGMSMGGYIALRLATKAPERVKALLLMSTRACNDEPERVNGYIEMRNTWQNIGPVAPLLDGLLNVIIGSDTAIKEQWRSAWSNYSGENIYHAMNAMLERDNIEHHLNNIKAPALIIHGSDDHGIPVELGQKLAESLPNTVAFHPIEGAAHAANLTHPKPVNQAIKQFLAEVI